MAKVKYLVDEHQLYCHTFHHPIYGLNVWVIWSQCPSRIHDFLVANHDGNSDEVGYLTPRHQGCVYDIEKDGDTITVIAFPWDYTGTDEQIASIAHEAAHAVFQLLRIRQIAFPRDTGRSGNDEENFCYHLTWMTKEILEALSHPEKHKFCFAHEKAITKKKK